MVRCGSPLRRAARKTLLPGRRARSHRIIVEDRRQPFFGLLDGPAFARGVVFDLVALDAADAEVVAFGVAEIEAADRGARPHGEAFGELDADLALAVQQFEQRRLLAVIGL